MDKEDVKRKLRKMGASPAETNVFLVIFDRVSARPFKRADVCKKIKRLSPETVKFHLRNLTKKGVLKRSFFFYEIKEELDPLEQTHTKRKPKNDPKTRKNKTI